MDIRKMFDSDCAVTGVSGPFCAYGSFGIIDGAENIISEKSENGFCCDCADFLLESDYESCENNVQIRKDHFTAKKDLILNHYASRFMLEGGEYEVYSQYSAWQHENCGFWQDLSCGIEISNSGIRSSESAAPMAAVRNKGNGKIIVFHLVPSAMWKISIKKRCFSGKSDVIIIETGMNCAGMNMKCAAGEKIDMPAVIVFEAQRKIDLDAWKLHALFNRLHPAGTLPVIYNTWMMNFDIININDILQQADTAAEIGVEYFAVDAGWFGIEGNWDDNIGNWSENQNGGFYGRLQEVFDHVRKRGMKAGLWLEPERALSNAEIVKHHPEYFIKGSGDNRFLDFANENALAYIFTATCALIEKYDLKYMKFDFNAGLAYDPSGCAFYRYFLGQKKFIGQIRAKYPDIYLTNCASGGNRLDLAQAALFNSVWVSDNQSPVEGVRIIRDTSIRFPRRMMESWDVRKFAEGFPKYKSAVPVSLPLSCEGAEWQSVVSVDDSYTYAFMTGGPMGFSADIASYPDEERSALKKLVAEYKISREFYKSAVLRIIHSTDNIIVLQFSDTDCRKTVIMAFVRYAFQDSLTVYPVLKSNSMYKCGNEEMSAETLSSEGIVFKISDNKCFTAVISGSDK